MSEAPGLINVLDREKHLVREIPAARFLRKELGEPDIFIYEHAKTRAWVVSHWVNKARGWFEELQLCNDPADIDRPMVESLKLWKHAATPTVREYREQLRSEEQSKLREQADRQEEAEDHMKFVRRKLGKSETDPGFQTAAFPVVKEGGAL